MDFSKFLVFGKGSLTNSDDTLTATFYTKASIHGLDGNDMFQTPDSGGLITSSDFYGGNGDDRLVVNENTGLLFGSKFNGGAGTDTLELTTNNRIVMSSEGTGDNTSVTVKSYLGWLSTGSMTGESVERYIIKASGFQDVLVGGAGNDFLDGRGGLDTFKGSAGDDSYVFDTVGEKVTGEAANGGEDTIFASISVKLGNNGAAENANIENLRLLGEGHINGTGNNLANLITGNTANNVIAGGAGNDTLYGKGGIDTFAFSEAGAANRDHIFDFDADDFIQLDRSQGAFAGLTAVNGTLDPADLSINNAVGTDAQLIYNRATGILSYDSNGTLAGGSEDVAFIGRLLDLKADHILLV